jgi:hypothetical protein
MADIYNSFFYSIIFTSCLAAAYIYCFRVNKTQHSEIEKGYKIFMSSYKGNTCGTFKNICLSIYPLLFVIQYDMPLN